MSVISLPTCGPVRTKQNFVCFAKNSVNSEAFLVQTNFSSPSKIFSIVTKVHRCHREELGTYNFLSGDNLICSLTAILRRVILFRTHDQLQLLQLAFLVRRKISRVSDANKVPKKKNWWVQNFQIFRRHQTLFFAVVRIGPKAVHYSTTDLFLILGGKGGLPYLVYKGMCYWA